MEKEILAEITAEQIVNGFFGADDLLLLIRVLFSAESRAEKERIKNLIVEELNDEGEK